MVSVTPQSPPPGAEPLARFYSQRLDWTKCEGAWCAALEVPVDYENPQGDTVSIAVVNVPARRSSKRIGSLVVNPGGPGASGFDYARAADFIVGKQVRNSLRHRGVRPSGRAAVRPDRLCHRHRARRFLGSDPTPDDAAEEQVFAQTARGFAEACGRNAGPLLAHVSTEEAARDMDVLRAALGEKKLTYLGASYGTYLGTIYADLFPEAVGRMVLDGVVPPDIGSLDMALGQAEGFERATRAWAAYCVRKGDCPLGDSVDQVMEGLRTFLASVDQSPLPADR